MNSFSIRLAILVSILLALCYLNSYFEIFSLNIFNCQNNRKPEGCFRVMTYNINASSNIGNIVKFKRRLIDEIEKHNPDILCIQELSPYVFRQIQTSLDSLFGYTDCMLIKKHSLRFHIYSKNNIRDFKRLYYLKRIDALEIDSAKKDIVPLVSSMPIYSAEIEVEPNFWITLIAVHLRSNAYSTARRSMNKDESWVEGIPLYFENFKIGSNKRKIQAERLRSYLDSLEQINKPIIIAGDFNDWSGSYCLNTIRKDMYKDAWWEDGFGFGITYDAWHLKLRLDHILYNPFFELVNVYVGKSSFSDHYPLIGDFRIVCR